MTTTTTFKGMDPNSRNSSRVLRPPGGGSNFSLGTEEPKEQPVRKNRMASNIFGTPEENLPSWARSIAPKSGVAKPSDVSESSEVPGSQKENSSDAKCGDSVEPKGLEGEVAGNTAAETEAASGPNEEKPLPPAPVSSPVAPAPVSSPIAPAPAPAPTRSRRNPPGGKSSLVLG